MKRILVTLIKYAIIVGLPLALSYYFLMLAQKAIFTPIAPDDTTTFIFEVAPNDTFKDVTKKLKKEKLIKSEPVLLLIAKLKGLDRRIKAGEYEVSRSMSLYSLIKIFQQGTTLERKVTIPEGSTLLQIVDLVEKSGIISSEKMLAALSDKDLMKALLVESNSFEGYLFPDTYHFPKGTSGQEIITTLVRQGIKQWPQDFSDQAEVIGMTRSQVITLASIVEKESGNFEEQPQIASVFHNRLKKGMKLQSDPTVIYGLENFDGNLRKADLENPHPFNTYVHSGLPPSPICNPGLSAIKATLYPAETDYLFFVANNNGSHIFSVEYAEHRRAVNTYQKRQ
jgi:UPF0755 protein